MSVKSSDAHPPVSETKELSFISKMRGAILFSGKTFTESYRSSKLWQGYFIFLICVGLLSTVLSTSTYPFFMEIFPHYSFSFTILGITIWISFSPQFFILSLLAISVFFLLVSFIISHFKGLKLKNTASALGFSATPLLILIFYLINKFILQSYRYELGPLLVGIGLIWSLLSGLIGLASLIRFEFVGLLNYAIKSIVYRKKRTYAAIIGIAVAVGLIVTPIPIISGYYTQLNSLAGSSQYSQYLIILEQGKADFCSSYIDSAILASLDHPNIQVISPETFLNINMSLNTTNSQVHLRGINYSIFQNFRIALSFQILPSKTFSDEQIFIGNYLASILNISFADLPINVSLTHDSEICNVTIIGIMTSNIHYDSELIAPINLTQILKPELNDKFSLIEVKLADPTLVDSTIQTLQADYPGLDIERENKLADFVTGIISKTVQSIWLLSIVVFIVMAFGMFHVMHTIIRESEREITILKSIGSSRFQIIRIFLYQASLLCLIGSVLGVLAGIFLTYTASFLVSSITTITVQPVFDFFIIGIAILLGLVSGVAGSLYPAYKASKTSIGERIR
ncbi:MAG: FtsX-like permease family protein [Candidatus Helarchaeota archaeon]|nr:FtsX-like permease family protein [Candidatus Helarchaeota archaeon]